MAPEASDEVSSSISAVATQCRIRLQQCLHLQPLMQYEWAENRLAEFNLWAAGAGAFAGERASLDAKLALQIDTQTFVISILSLLLGCVEKCRDTELGKFSNYPPVLLALVRYVLGKLGDGGIADERFGFEIFGPGSKSLII
ncbi:hypothetical protein BJ166DRAFT_597014 [Pestalotiopsis sp. NC0098]|nr:hypothetical protein BJ166DRAFT_597014 [Pestalotiopsis sp. NC0098]